MCRFAAFSSTRPLPLYRFLVQGDNSFAIQSLEHPDGWGIAHYQGGALKVVRSVLPAIADPKFEALCFDDEAEILLGHIRQATTGEIRKENTHPFRFQNWVFAHNGQIADIRQHESELRQKIAPKFTTLISGTTDSEIYFCLFLTALERNGFNDSKEGLGQAVGEAVEVIQKICDISQPSSLSCVATNGEVMIATSIRKGLSFREEVGDENRSVYVSSEAIAAPKSMSRPDSWQAIGEGHCLYIDKMRRTFHFSI